MSATKTAPATFPTRIDLPESDRHALDEHHDKATADVFTEISRTADKQLWFPETHVQH